MPDSPYPSCREPTRTVMLTVTFGLEASGKSSSRRPLSNRYSVIPSTVATFFGGESARAHAGAIATRDRQRARIINIDVSSGGGDGGRWRVRRDGRQVSAQAYNGGLPAAIAWQGESRPPILVPGVTRAESRALVAATDAL